MVLLNSMKKINKYICERLHINKDIGLSNHLKDVSNTEINWRLKALYNALSSKEKYDLMRKVENHYKAHNNPKILFNVNTKTYKIFNLYICAILCEWDEAIQLLRDKILNCDDTLKPLFFDGNDKDANTNMLDAFIYNLYKESITGSLGDRLKYDYFKYNQTIEECNKHFEHYFELYNIQY